MCGTELKPLVLFIIIASAVSNIVAAQPNVGLGELKIGMSEEEFLDVPDIKGRRIIPVESTGALPWDAFFFGRLVIRCLQNIGRI